MAVCRKVKKYKRNYERIKRLVNEETRHGSLFKEALKGVLDAASRLIGAPLTRHPYYKYHKVHIDLLASSIDVMTAHEQASIDWRKAWLLRAM